jgi:hypothetical protein
MSASQEQPAVWLDPDFWERLHCLEAEHQRIQAQHEQASRRLQQVVAVREESELRIAWLAYCEVIAELDRATAALEMLRTCKA